MKVLSVVGARPNFVKMAPVIAELQRRGIHHTLVHTGQHYDAAMSQVFFEEFGLADPDHLLDVGSASHAVQTARVMERLEPVILSERPDVVLVPGDVNSTLATALVVAKLGVQLGHVESGLRSYDRTMPEEINRVVADAFSDYLFVHSAEAIDNLAREGIPNPLIHFVGNTMIDTLKAMEERFRNAEMAMRLGVCAGDYLLVTLHRPALVDGPLLPLALSELRRIAEDIPVVFPVHPRTRRMLDVSDVGAVTLIDPVGYIEFLSLEADARAVLTDSGGVQEETTFLRVPCYTLRDNTERPVTITLGTNTLLGLDPRRIGDLPRLLAEGSHDLPREPPPHWDGLASERLVCTLSEAE